MPFTHSSSVAALTYNFTGKAAGYRFDVVNGTVNVVDIDMSDGDDGSTTFNDSKNLVFSDHTYTLSLPGPVGQVRINTTTVNNQTNPKITTLESGGYVAIWESGVDIYAQRYDPKGYALGNEVQINTYTINYQISPSITTLSGGGYIVTWQYGGFYNEHDFNYYEGDIHAQRYDANGNATGNEVRINTTTTGDQVTPVTTALSDGGYVIAWASGTYGNYDIYAQRYAVDGSTLGNEVRVNTTTSVNQADPAMTALDDGGYVVSWQSGIYGNYDIYAQRYNANGDTFGSEMRVNTTTAGDQSSVALSSLDGGGYILTWQSQESTGSSYDIYAQRYDFTGNAVGNEVRVNTTTLDNQSQPVIASLNNGDYVIAWQSHSNSNDNICAQRYAANGIAVGTQLRVDIVATHHQVTPTITALHDGGYMLAWASGNGENYYYDYDIYAQRYDASDLPVTGVDISGGNGADTFNCGSGSQRLFGLAGDDTLVGGAGADFMVGGLGNDTYGVDDIGDVIEETSTLPTEIDSVHSSISYTLSSTLENLTLGGSANLSGTGNAANNQLIGNSGNNTLTAAAGNDSLDGGTGNDWLEGGTGNDTVDGGIGYDRLDGGTGNDLYRVDNLDQVIEAENAGIDTVEASVSYVLGNTLEHLTLTGTTAINATGNALNNRIQGNSGNNQLDGKAGADTMTGGSGCDTYIVDDSSDVVKETSTTSTDIDTIYASLSWTLGLNIEQLWLTGDNALDATGNTLNNLLSGNSDENVLNGMAGNDTVTYADALSRVEVSLTETDYQYTQGDGFDQLISIENLIGSTYDDSLTGNDVANTLDGSQGNDTLSAGSGADTLTGGSGTDSLIGEDGDDHLNGGAGNDTLSGGAGSDTLDGGDGEDLMLGGTGNDTYNVGAGDIVRETSALVDEVDTVVSANSYRLGVNLENLWLTGTRQLNATGNALNNTLGGNVGNNVINGGSGTDTAHYAGASAAVTVSLALTSAQVTGGAGIDTLLNIENLAGSDYNDRLTGNASNNVLFGRNGNDTLNGGQGADTLSGGLGNDTFDFNALSELGLGSAARDVINDFAPGLDKIDLSTIDAKTSQSGNQAFSFVTNFTTSAGQVRYAGGIIYLNTDTDTEAEYEIQLIGSVPALLTATNFVL